MVDANNKTVCSSNQTIAAVGVPLVPHQQGKSCDCTTTLPTMTQEDAQPCSRLRRLLSNLWFATLSLLPALQGMLGFGWFSQALLLQCFQQTQPSQGVVYVFFLQGDFDGVFVSLLRVIICLQTLAWIAVAIATAARTVILLRELSKRDDDESKCCFWRTVVGESRCAWFLRFVATMALHAVAWYLAVSFSWWLELVSNEVQSQQGQVNDLILSCMPRLVFAQLIVAFSSLHWYRSLHQALFNSLERNRQREEALAVGEYEMLSPC